MLALRLAIILPMLEKRDGYLPHLKYRVEAYDTVPYSRHGFTFNEFLFDSLLLCVGDDSGRRARAVVAVVVLHRSAITFTRVLILPVRIGCPQSR